MAREIRAARLGNVRPPVEGWCWAGVGRARLVGFSLSAAGGVMVRRRLGRRLRGGLEGGGVCVEGGGRRWRRERTKVMYPTCG